jgi:hydroxymethylpyrimidine pyrophosphatase-like HAD family hydrolase
MIHEATIKGRQSARLVMFDLDDTLIISSAKIKVLDPKTQKVIKELTPAEFNFFKPSKKTVLSFSDFESADVLKKSEFIIHVYDKLKDYYTKGVHVGIVTARSSSTLIRDFFLSNGIDIHPELVIAVNDPQYNFTGSVAQKKKQAIHTLIEQGYEDFIFFDDNEENLQLAKETEKEKGVRVETIKV